MKRKRLAWLLVIILMGLIFYLSHQPASRSNKLSKGISQKIVDIVEKASPKKDIDIRSFNHILRKNAHLFAYLLLGILVVNALRVSGVENNRSIALALLICIFYAISDEVHQLFIAGRGGQVKDVIIDSAGALTGIIIYTRYRDHI